MASANHTSAATPVSVQEPSSNTLIFSRAELEATIIDAEQHSTYPNAGKMAQMIWSMFFK